MEFKNFVYYTLLHMACLSGNLELFKNVLSTSEDINMQTIYKLFLLYFKFLFFENYVFASIILYGI